MDQAFAPPGEGWTRVSPRLRTMRLLLTYAGFGLVAVVAVVLTAVLSGPVPAVVVVVLGALTGWAAVRLVERNVRSWGYAERADDLLVTRGVMFRKLVVVPYGRMQFVDVAAGPLERRFGIATVQMHTAAAETDARIPGLVPGEAARLRDRLAARGEARSAGL